MLFSPVSLHRLGGQRDHRKPLEAVTSADLLHRLVPVHLREHDVHQDEVDVRARLELLEPLRPGLREDDLHPVALEDAGEREDVPHVVVDDQDLLPQENGVAVVELLERAPPLRRQPVLHPVEEERGLVEQPLGRADVLDDDRLGVAPELRLLAPRQVLARVDDHRHVAELAVPLQLLEQLEAGAVGQLQVEDDAVEPLLCERVERLFARPDRGDLDVVPVPGELYQRPALLLVVLDDQEVLDVTCEELLEVVEGAVEGLLVERLLDHRHGAGAQRVPPVAVGGDHVDGDVARGGMVLEVVEHRRAVHHGQLQVEDDRVRLELVDEREAGVTALGDDPLEAALARFASIVFASSASSSTTTTTRSPGWISSRSSATSPGRRSSGSAVGGTPLRAAISVSSRPSSVRSASSWRGVGVSGNRAGRKSVKCSPSPWRSGRGSRPRAGGRSRG